MAREEIIYVKIKFYRGIRAIARFLELHERTVFRLLKNGKLPAKKDESGRWVMSNRDYYLSLKEPEKNFLTNWNQWLQ